MSKQLVVFGLFVLILGLFGSGVCTGNARESAVQDEAAKFEEEANALVDIEMLTGWVDAISEERIIIDDTIYLITENTAFPSGKDCLVRGGFVGFTLGKENYITQISTATPLRSDIKMRHGEQFSRTVEEPEKKPLREGSQPRLENGVWVN